MSESSHAIEIYLTSAQLRKYRNKQPFQLSHNQLLDNDKAKHLLQLNINNPGAKKLHKAINGSGLKGHRFTAEQLSGGEIVGGSIASKMFKKVGKTIKAGINKGVHFIKKNAGAVVQGIKGAIPKEALEGLLDTAIAGVSSYYGKPEIGMALNQSVNKGLDGVYAHDFGKPLFSRKNKAAIGETLKNTAANVGYEVGQEKRFKNIYDSGVSDYNNFMSEYKNYNKNKNVEPVELPGDHYEGYSGGSLRRKRGRPMKGGGLGQNIGLHLDKAFSRAGDKYKIFAGAVNKTAIKPIEKIYKNTLKKTIINPIETTYLNTLSQIKGGAIVGKDHGPGGVFRGGLIKGSDAAKNHMAKIRAMRKIKSKIIGGSFI